MKDYQLCILRNRTLVMFFFITLFWTGCTPSVAKDGVATRSLIGVSHTASPEPIQSSTGTPVLLTPVVSATRSPVALTPTASRLNETREAVLRSTPIVATSPSATSSQSEHLLRVEELPVRGGGRVALSSDGTLLATALMTETDNVQFPVGHIVQVFDLKTLQPIRVFDIPRTDINGTEALAFSPDGSLLAAGGLEQIVLVWDVDTGELVYEFPLQGFVRDLSFSSDGTSLAVTSPGEIGRVIVWNLESRTATEYPGHIPGTSVDFIPGTTTLTIALANTAPQQFGEGIVLLWNVEDNTTEIVFSGQTASGVAVSPDGTVLAASVDGSLHLWDLENNSEISVDSSAREVGWVRIIFSEKETLATIDGMGTRGRVTVWNTEGELCAQMQEEGVLDIAYTSEGHLISSEYGSSITIWKLIAAEC